MKHTIFAVYYYCGTLKEGFKTNNQAMIEIKNISFKYAGGKSLVFDDFSLTLEKNNIYGLLGRNGTGKSTLLYLICGLLRPRSGSVTCDGAEAWRRRPEMLREMFIVPEEIYLPSVSLDDYVKMNEPFYPHFSRETLGSCLSDFELPHTLRLNELSMGQKKKVYMSFALAAGTRLLLMDEPTNGLDIPSKRQFRRVVTQNMTDDRTLVISTHQVHDVEQLLDHILILDRQGMLLDSPVADVCARYSFELRMPGAPAGDVLYAEPSLNGNAVIARRGPDSPETPLNLELLFDAVVRGMVR